MFTGSTSIGTPFRSRTNEASGSQTNSLEATARLADLSRIALDTQFTAGPSDGAVITVQSPTFSHPKQDGDARVAHAMREEGPINSTTTQEVNR
jgi:hypothetical protein